MGLLSGLFGGGGGSRSSSTIDDNRVGSDNGGISAGGGSIVTINNESPEVIEFAEKLVNSTFTLLGEQVSADREQAAATTALSQSAVGNTTGFGPDAFVKVAAIGAAAVVVIYLMKGMK